MTLYSFFQSSSLFPPLPSTLKASLLIDKIGRKAVAPAAYFIRKENEPEKPRREKENNLSIVVVVAGVVHHTMFTAMAKIESVS